MATEYETLPSFVTHLVSVVETCIERGMQPPFIACLVSTNGSILAVRFNVPDQQTSWLSIPRTACSGCRSMAWWLTRPAKPFGSSSIKKARRSTDRRRTTATAGLPRLRANAHARTDAGQFTEV